MTTLLTVVVPVRTVTEGNAKGYWRTAHRRAKEQRNATAWALMGTVRWTGPGWRPQPPLTVKLTRIAPRQLDPGDNCNASMKHVRDEVAKWLCIDDRHEHLCRYEYAQEKGKPREYAVRIEIARRGSE